MNKREAALAFIRENSRCLQEAKWPSAAEGGFTKIEFRAVMGHAFFLMDMGKNGWGTYHPLANNVDVEIQQFESISREKFQFESDEK